MTDKSMRGELKSITFDGIADAMVDQWGYLWKIIYKRLHIAKKSI
jgi:hypothetical protein